MPAGRFYIDGGQNFTESPNFSTNSVCAGGVRVDQPPLVGH
ncbi:MAG: hypothetical protein [Olavius algarvensis Gamma 3 endosymbiont]|nr:MAG: hypothetical protein [Olavius algarvensis Gamma 3 endosymbiont]